MRGEERKEGPLNKERGDGVGDGSVQSHSGANLNPKTVKNRGSVLKGGEANGVALTQGMHADMGPTYRHRACIPPWDTHTNMGQSYRHGGRTDMGQMYTLSRPQTDFQACALHGHLIDTKYTVPLYLIFPK
jgi:hypothetical protein